MKKYSFFFLIATCFFISCNGHSIDLFSTNSDQHFADTAKLKVYEPPTPSGPVCIWAINLRFKNAPLSQVLDSIRKNAAYDINVNRDCWTRAVPITLNLKNVSGDSALKVIAKKEKGCAFTYTDTLAEKLGTVERYDRTLRTIGDSAVN